MDLTFLAQADAVTLTLEKAKRALEAAKFDLDAAKQAYDEMLSQSDEHGIPKAKLKKLTEERVNALFESGMIEVRKDVSVAPKEAKVERPKKPRKIQSIGVEEVIATDESNFDQVGDENLVEPEAGHA